MVHTASITDWLQAVGTIGAFGGVLYEFRRRRQDDELKAAERRDGELAQARLVTASLGPAKYEENRVHIHAKIENLSSAAVLDVILHYDFGRSSYGFPLGHLEAGERVERTITVQGAWEAGTFPVGIGTLLFTDAAGRAWSRQRTKLVRRFETQPTPAEASLWSRIRRKKLPELSVANANTPVGDAPVATAYIRRTGDQSFGQGADRSTGRDGRPGLSGGPLAAVADEP